MSCSPHRMKGARLGAGFAEAAVLAAAGQIQGAADSAPFHSCAKELLPSADQGRQSSGGSDCSTEEAYPPSVSAPQARKPPASNKRSRAQRANTPSPVSEESAESTGPEDGGSRAAKRDRDHGDAGKASGQGEPGKGRRASQPWSAEEDELLQRAVAEIGPKRWSAIAIAVPGRSGKQCRLRWCNQIDPSIKHDARRLVETAAHPGLKGSAPSARACWLPRLGSLLQTPERSRSSSEARRGLRSAPPKARVSHAPPSPGVDGQGGRDDPAGVSQLWEGPPAAPETPRPPAAPTTAPSGLSGV
jgi:hypothetical protein